MANGYPIASVHTSPDGRQNLAITAANAYYLRHSQVLGYGIVNWVTKGIFLGKKRIAMSRSPMTSSSTTASGSRAATAIRAV